MNVRHAALISGLTLLLGGCASTLRPGSDAAYFIVPCTTAGAIEATLAPVASPPTVDPSSSDAEQVAPQSPTCIVLASSGTDRFRNRSYGYYNSGPGSGHPLYWGGYGVSSHRGHNFFPSHHGGYGTGYHGGGHGGGHGKHH